MNRTSAIDNWRRLMLTTDTGHDPGTLPIPTPPFASSPFSILSNPPYLTRIGCIRTSSLVKKGYPAYHTIRARLKIITFFLQMIISTLNGFSISSAEKEVRALSSPSSKVCRHSFQLSRSHDVGQGIAKEQF